MQAFVSRRKAMTHPSSGPASTAGGSGGDGHVVVGLAGVETGADGLLELRRTLGMAAAGRRARTCSRASGSASSEARVSRTMALKSSEPAGLVQRPEGFGAVRIELEELVGLEVAGAARRHGRLVEGTEKRQRVQPRCLETGAQVGRDGAAEDRRGTSQGWCGPCVRRQARSRRRRLRQAAKRSMRSWSTVAQSPLSSKSRRARSRRAPASDQRMPAWRRRAWTTCLWALSTEPLPMP